MAGVRRTLGAHTAHARLFWLLADSELVLSIVARHALRKFVVQANISQRCGSEQERREKVCVFECRMRVCKKRRMKVAETKSSDGRQGNDNGGGDERIRRGLWYWVRNRQGDGNGRTVSRSTDKRELTSVLLVYGSLERLEKEGRL